MTVHANDAHPFPIYNARFRLIVPLLDADGDPISPSSADTELSQDLGTFADATNEATEIATSSGVVYVDLIATEMDTTSTTVQVKSTGAKTTIAVLNPRRLPVIRTGTAQAGSGTTITLDSSASAIDDYYVGCYVNITNDSPSGVLGQARMITDYVGSTKVATVATYGTNPSSASTFEILATELWIQRLADVNAFGGVAATSSGGRPEVNTTHAAGTAWGSGAITAAAIASDAITAAKIADGAIDAGAIASDAITAAKIADGAIDAATFAAGAINAAAIATGAIDADAVAADAVTEIQNGLATLSSVEATYAYLEAIVPVFNDVIGSTGNDTTHLHLPNLTYGNDEINYYLLVIYDDSEGEYHSRYIEDWVNATKLATVSTLPFTPQNATDKYWLLTFRADVVGGSGLDAAGVRAAVGLASANLDTQLSGVQADTDDIQTRLPAALVSGRMVSLVNELSNNVITAGHFATGAISAGALASDAVAEIADGVWDEATSGHTTAGTFGEQVKTDIDEILTDTGTTLQGEVDGIQADTEDIQARLPAALTGAGNIKADVLAISGDATAADNEEAFFDGTGYAGTGNTIPTVTTLTNDPSGVTTLLSRIPSALFSGITSMAQWLGLLAGKQTGNSTARTEVRATGAGSGTFDETTDSHEAIRDNMGTAQTGDSFARLGAPAGASVSADILIIDNLVDDLESRVGTPSNLGSGATVAANLVDIEGQTDDIGTAGAGLTAIPWAAAWDAEVQSEVQDALDATLADSVPADGTRPSIAQAIYMITQFLTEKAVSGTTVTVKKVDGSTTLMTFTLDSSSSPTSITRS